MYEWLDYVIVAGQFLFSLAAAAMLLSLLPARASSALLYQRLWSWRKREPSSRLLRLLFLKREELLESERALMLASCGFELTVLGYSVYRRLLMLLCYLLLFSLAVGANYGLWQLNMAAGSAVATAAVALIVLHTDMYWLKLYRELRAVAITREIYAISHQLLYFEDSNLHIHNKLRRCLPYSKLLHRDLETLLAEWYHDPADALQTLKRKIGTPEGISFVESIDALRQQHEAGFYELLRAHLRDYKERLELAKESRKEVSSYVLYVIAGIPILYTFQVFLYPWVQEVNKLMSSMN